ncbi:hypothetical protein PsYK624_063780 [Phanerochaete sordida]|uniref:RGS1/SST2-like Fungal-Differentiation Regulator domain-containing protein n=1 Tax=Phanerochaete sordida TaxID=48140 RepID=A0A9P3LD55_9APHY|nr:hypothetical protein PsYK624_063780 [Phanerochaete sordida]
MASVAMRSGAASSRKGVLKMTKAGRPFLRNLLDIYAAFILALPLHTTFRWFTKYHDAFVFDDAMHILANLRVSQPVSGASASEEPGVTMVKTVAYSLAQDAARQLCELFLAARLITNATDDRSCSFTHMGIFMITPKGLHVTEQFIARNGGSAFFAKSKTVHAMTKSVGAEAEPSVVRLVASYPVSPVLLHVVRRWEDDEIIASTDVVRAVFRWILHDASARVPQGPAVGSPGKVRARLVLSGPMSAEDLMTQLLDCTSLVNADEAGTMLAHCVRLGLLELASDASPKRKGGKVYTAQMDSSEDGEGAQTVGEFRASSKTMYRVTAEGRRIAGLAEIPAQSEAPLAQQDDGSDASHEIPLLASTYSTPSALPHSTEERTGGVYVTKRNAATDG